MESEESEEVNEVQRNRASDERTVYETCYCGYEASDEEDMLDHIAYETGRAR